jgi:hypothetical protein
MVKENKAKAKLSHSKQTYKFKFQSTKGKKSIKNMKSLYLKVIL